MSKMKAYGVPMPVIEHILDHAMGLNQGFNVHHVGGSTNFIC